MPTRLSGPLFTCSWDDGHPSDLRLAELLDRHGFPGTFYVPLRNVEGLPVLDAPGLRELAQRMELGSHTLDHVYADRVPLPQWQQQVVTGKRALEDVLGQAVEGFCYPGGRLPRGGEAIVREAGFRYARSCVNLCSGWPDRAFALPTTLQCYPHTRGVLLRNALRQPPRWQRLQTLALLWPAEDLAQRLCGALDRVCEGGGVFHLWGHAWELDALGLWPLLDRFLAYAAERVPAAARVSNGELVRRLQQEGRLR